MKASDLKLANEEMRSFILNQAELRLQGQIQFAAAADQRSAMVGGVATALATVCFGAAAQVLTTAKGLPLSVTAASLGAGFAVAAWFAIQSAACQDFHPSGFYPKNFVGDVRSRKRMALVQVEIAEDLNERLEFNSNVLTLRGRQITAALRIMLATPFLGTLVFSLAIYNSIDWTAIESALRAAWFS